MTNLEHYIIYKLLHKFYKPTVILIYMLLFCTKYPLKVTNSRCGRDNLKQIHNLYTHDMT